MSEGKTMNEKDEGEVLETTEELFLNSVSTNKKRRIAENEPERNINILNDDCLLYMFTFLPINDHLVLEEVCRNWEKLMGYVWSRKTVLDVDNIMYIIRNTTAKIPGNLLELILARCGPHLKTIKLTKKTDKRDWKTKQIIAKYGRHIEVLDLSGIGLSKPDIREIAQSCNKLRKIHFDLDRNVELYAFNKLFSKNKHLESVHLQTYGEISEQFLQHLSPKLKELQLSSCKLGETPFQKLEVSTLQSALKIFKSLKVLRLDSCASVTTNYLTDIVNALPNLESLALNFYFSNQNLSLEPIKYLTKLTSLSLSNNYAVTNRILKMLSVFCRDIEVLDISYCDTDEVMDFVYIAKMPKLRKLTLDGLDTVCEESLRCLATSGALQILSVAQCENFDDEAALLVLRHCEELTHLDMTGCKKITKNTITNAVNVLKSHSSKNSKLKLEVGSTEIDLKFHKVADEHPLLEVVDESDSSSDSDWDYDWDVHYTDNEDWKIENERQYDCHWVSLDN